MNPSTPEIRAKAKRCAEQLHTHWDHVDDRLVPELIADLFAVLEAAAKEPEPIPPHTPMPFPEED